MAVEISEHGVLRIGGSELPVDVFRRPNEFTEVDFGMVWDAARIREDNVALAEGAALMATRARAFLAMGF